MSDLSEKAMNIGDGVIGHEYVNRFGHYIQLIGKHQNSVDVLVLATNRIKEIPSEYRVIPRNKFTDSAIDKHHKKVDKKIADYQAGKDVEPAETPDNILFEPFSDETKRSKKETLKRKKVSERLSETVGKMTAKQMVIDLLRKGPQTRDSLAQALLDNKLTAKRDIKKVKSFISVMLILLRKKDKINVVTLSPGKYIIKDHNK